MDAFLLDSRSSLRRLASFEFGDLGFEAGESRLDGDAPIVLRRWGQSRLTSIRIMPMLDKFRETHTVRAVGMHYGLVIYWSKAKNTFLVEVPELPGCMTDGATYEEAVTKAQIVIDGVSPD